MHEPSSHVLENGERRATQPEPMVNRNVFGFVSHSEFSKIPLELLYQQYYNRQRLKDLRVLLVYAILFSVSAIVITAMITYGPMGSRTVQTFFIIFIVGFLVSITMAVLNNLRHLPPTFAKILPLMIWLLMCVLVYVQSMQELVLASNGVGPVLFTSYSVYIMLPYKLSICALLSCLTCLVHTLVVGIASSKDQDTGRMVGANLILYVGSNILGIMLYLMGDRKQRRAFLETKQSLEVKMKQEEQAEEHERLLLSVLPRHVAAEVREDLGAVVDGQFKKIYITRYENVSILFADIVGFTALSSTCTAAELVKILNALFASFDKLSEKYHQLRMKILGDCYYCISGAPVPRSDHAVLSVHMGLSMVEAIRAVRERTKSGVDMRVGIHTGAVLAGILGQRQWQFDVYSKDVIFANKMESGGIAGRVHISDATMNFLNGEFEVEDGFGESREDAIKNAGRKTYLISAVIKPYPEGTLDQNLKENGALMKKSITNGDVERGPKTDDELNRLLYAELIEKEDASIFAKNSNKLTLHFKDSELEKSYDHQKDRQSGTAISASSIVLAVCFLAQLLVLPRTLTTVLTFLLAEGISVTIMAISLAANFPKEAPPGVTRFAMWIEITPWFRTVWSSTVVFLMVTPQIVGLVSCKDDYTGPANMTVDLPNNAVCLYPEYFTNMAVLALLANTMLVQLRQVLKSFLMVAITLAHCLLNMLALSKVFDDHDMAYIAKLPDGSPFPAFMPTKYTVSVMLIVVLIALVYFNRHMEITARKMFVWRTEVIQQRHVVEEMRHKNEELVYNILPTHVAKYFLGSKKEDEELYSQSYDEVGVMFAAMPNFTDFYNEDGVTNKGIECLRFLNEVISDYDELLNEPRFKAITKIKTIGSTYMAASGMVNTEIYQEDTPVTTRWRHLADLCEFALALKEILNTINAQSFNSFVLRIGINHGPILAGVIGAKKPHYDIWGNSVNVASRMESTGKANHIQVLGSTMDILVQFGYQFEKRGIVKVKGKGDLLTYYLVGKQEDATLPNMTEE